MAIVDRKTTFLTITGEDADRTKGLAMENKRLLERAIAVQGRVIGVVARAAAATTEPAGYGPERGRRPTPVALVARA